MKRAAPFLLLALVLSACSTKVDTRADKAAVEAGLYRYSQLLLSMDSAGIAAMFAPDGEVVNPSQPAVHGRDAIRKFIASFSDFHVISNTDTPTSTLIDGSTAEQIGVYEQSVKSPQGHLFKVSGRLEIEWVKAPSGEWQIMQLATFPAK
ncbi:MAG TPA: nuclear transport factor 2 family protein [Opitutaceae bacterium]